VLDIGPSLHESDDAQARYAHHEPRVPEVLFGAPMLGLPRRPWGPSVPVKETRVELRPKQSTIKGPSDWFTGDVFIDPVAQSQGPASFTLGSVHFTPCAHTAWHRHSLGQTLCVTEGEGFVQARGGPLVRIRSGDIVITPPGEWHWHGATPTTFMTHLALTEGDTEWGEHLTVDEYPST
jgi:quercetin dioxygenase-like cupin family protein